MKKGCLKGCLTAFFIYLACCLLLGMCAALFGDDTDADTTDSSTIPSIIDETTETPTVEEPTTEVPHNHEFEPATCIIPKKCTICGTTEGEVLEHTWIDATCTAPKTCSVCGSTDGNTLEHSWSEATCTTPQTCTVCQTTTGSLAAHNYSNGKCKICKEPDPTDPRNITVWIPTNGGKKYHSRPGCSNMKNPRETTLANAKKKGYGPCARCH